MGLNDFSALNALKPDSLILMPQAKSVTSPVENTDGKRVPTNVLALTQIPEAMRRMGWFTSAALMQRWFDSPAWTMDEDWKRGPPDPAALSPAKCDEEIVKIAWAQKFPRAVEALQKADKVLTTQPSLVQLCKRLRKAGWDGVQRQSIGYAGMPARLMDSQAQINIVELGSKLDTLDDMYGALGIALVKVGVVGEAWLDRVSQRRYFRMRSSGLYIRDTYDFSGTQFLGIWTEDRVLGKAAQAAVTVGDGGNPRLTYRLDEPGGTQVWNEDFRRYRQRTGRGGDFVLYSDVHWIEHDKVMDISAAWDALNVGA